MLDLVDLGTFWGETDVDCRVFLAVEENRTEMEGGGDSNADPRKPWSVVTMLGAMQMLWDSAFGNQGQALVQSLTVGHRTGAWG